MAHNALIKVVEGVRLLLILYARFIIRYIMSMAMYKQIHFCRGVHKPSLQVCMLVLSQLVNPSRDSRIFPLLCQSTKSVFAIS